MSTDSNGIATSTLAVRGTAGGVLMGLANLVPGISGGTMLLAVGIYPRFINAVAEISTFRFRVQPLLTLAFVVAGAAAAIVLLAGTVGDLVVNHRWIMYSIFIGLTLGGAPIVWKMVRPLDGTVIAGALVGIVAMGALALMQASGATGGSSSEGRAYVLLFIAGVAGGSAMILPGVSGGYLLLILGQYVTILHAIDDARAGASARDWGAIGEAMHVFVPVGIGVVVGVVGVSNIVRLLLKKFERPTLAVLLGLLLGAVLGLWPFQEPVEPAVGDTIKGQLVTEATLADIEIDDWSTQTFTPGVGHIAGALGLILAGFGASLLIGKLGAGKDEAKASAKAG